MKDNTDTIRDGLSASALMILLIVPIAAWHGFVGAKLWGWFVVPLGAPQVGVFHAAGLSLIMTFASGVYAVSAKIEGESKEGGIWKIFWTNISRSTILPAFLLLFGWIYFLLAF